MKTPENNTAVKVVGLGKRYRIGTAPAAARSRAAAVRRAVGAPFRYLASSLRPAAGDEILWALRDVSFSVSRGEVLGIVGRNGAGKSTLLKILSRITEPTEGSARMEGRVGSLIEVGTGFHPELTGRENVYLNGAILGMRKGEIDAQFEEIVDFSGVGRFIETPVKRYSSGMRVRLGFAVAAHLQPEVLIIDEVLAVGDVGFQKRCLQKMDDIAHGGRTVLFVSHNMGAIRSLCHRCCLVDDGRLAAIGDVEEVVGRYEEMNALQGVTAEARFDRPGQASPWILSARVYCNGRVSASLPMGGDLAVEVEFGADPPIADPRLGVAVSTIGGTRLVNTNNRFQPEERYDSPRTEGRLRCELGALPLVPGRYLVSLYLGGEEGDTHVEVDRLGFDVHETDLWGTGKTPQGSAFMWWPARFPVGDRADPDGALR